MDTKYRTFEVMVDKLQSLKGKKNEALSKQE